MDTDEQANLRHKNAGKSTYTVKKTNKKRDIKIVFVKLEGKNVRIWLNFFCCHTVKITYLDQVILRSCMKYLSFNQFRSMQIVPSIFMVVQYV